MASNRYTCNNMIRIDDTNNDDEEQCILLMCPSFSLVDVYDDKESYKQCIFKPFYAIHLVTTFDFELEDSPSYETCHCSCKACQGCLRK